MGVKKYSGSDRAIFELDENLKDLREAKEELKSDECVPMVKVVEDLELR